MSGRVGASLRWAWLRAAAGMTLGLVAVMGIVSVHAGEPRAHRWALSAGVALAFELWVLRRNLTANRSDTGGKSPREPAGRPHDDLGLANHVTLVRGGLFACVAGFAVVRPTPTVTWLPALFYGVGCAVDAVDGALARRLDRTTVLGARLDMTIDTLGFLIAPVVAVLWGRLPLWYLSLSLARYLFKAGRRLRRRRGRPVYDLPESRVRRPLAGLQMAFITLALTPVVPDRIVTVLAAVVLAPSLAVFGRDYLAISGRLAPKNEQSDTPSQG